MREILFRGKRKDNGEWETGSLLVERMNTSDQRVMIADKMTGYPTLALPETIGQYTGLTDKNGKKIFEGDIIKIVPYCDYSDDYCISKVYSYNGVFCVDYQGDDFDSTALGFLEDYLPDGDFEVIGNIYDDNLEELANGR